MSARDDLNEARDAVRSATLDAAAGLTEHARPEEVAELLAGLAADLVGKPPVEVILALDRLKHPAHRQELALAVMLLEVRARTPEPTPAGLLPGATLRGPALELDWPIGSQIRDNENDVWERVADGWSYGNGAAVEPLAKVNDLYGPLTFLRWGPA